MLLGSHGLRSGSRLLWLLLLGLLLLRLLLDVSEFYIFVNIELGASLLRLLHLLARLFRVALLSGLCLLGFLAYK